MNTKELIMNINETKNRMQICVNNLNSSIIQAGVLKGPVIEESSVTILAKLYELTTACIVDIYNLDKLCNLLESLSGKKKRRNCKKH